MNKNLVKILAILKEDLQGTEFICLDNPKGKWARVCKNFDEALIKLSWGIDRKDNPELRDLEIGLKELKELFSLMKREGFEFQLEKGAYDVKIVVPIKVVQLGYVCFPKGIKGLREDLLKYHRLVRDYDIRVKK